MIYLQSCMYYKKNLEQWFKLKRKREFGLLKKKELRFISKTQVPFGQPCYYLFKRNLPLRPNALGLTMSSCFSFFLINSQLGFSPGFPCKLPVFITIKVQCYIWPKEDIKILKTNKHTIKKSGEIDPKLRNTNPLQEASFLLKYLQCFSSRALVCSSDINPPLWLTSYL